MSDYRENQIRYHREKLERLVSLLQGIPGVTVNIQEWVDKTAEGGETRDPIRDYVYIEGKATGSEYPIRGRVQVRLGSNSAYLQFSPIHGEFLDTLPPTPNRVGLASITSKKVQAWLDWLQAYDIALIQQKHRESEKRRGAKELWESIEGDEKRVWDSHNSYSVTRGDAVLLIHRESGDITLKVPSYGNRAFDLFQSIKSKQSLEDLKGVLEEEENALLGPSVNTLDQLIKGGY